MVAHSSPHFETNRQVTSSEIRGRGLKDRDVTVLTVLKTIMMGVFDTGINRQSVLVLDSDRVDMRITLL